MMKSPPRAAGRRKRLVAICRALPEADATAEGRRDEHLGFRVRKKTFAYYLYDHHGDGRIALVCKAVPGEQQTLVGRHPERFFVPPYLGPKGWIGVRLDLSRVAWGEIVWLLGMAYRLSAPRTLVARLERD